MSAGESGEYRAMSIEQDHKSHMLSRTLYPCFSSIVVDSGISMKYGVSVLISHFCSPLAVLVV